MINVLYIHGMGGGGDSRIPSILNSYFASCDGPARQVKVTVRTYDFDPESAHIQISAWVEELRPALVIGESLGSLHAVRIKGIPHLLISPALNAPVFLHAFAYLTLIPGMSWLLGKIYKPREGDRQKLDFRYGLLRKYRDHRKAALSCSSRNGNTDLFVAFIGLRDHYRKYGVVSIRTWKKHFGQTVVLYDGTHFTEEEYIYSLVIPQILNILGIKK